MGRKYFIRPKYCTARLGQGYCTSLSRQHKDVGVTSHRDPYRLFDVSCCVPVSLYSTFVMERFIMGNDIYLRIKYFPL